MTDRDNTLRRIVEWVLDEILDRDARPGHLTRLDPMSTEHWETS